MKILVTGANGHIGSTLVRQLLQQGHEVRAFVRKSSDTRSLLGLNVELSYGDILDHPSVQAAVRSCQAIFHCAAVYSTSVQDKDVVFRTANEGTRNLFEAVLKENKDIQKIVYISSTASVGSSDAATRLLDEAQYNTSTKCPYSMAKLQSEQLARSYFDRHGLPVVFALPSTAIGPGFYKATPSVQSIINYFRAFPPFYYEAGYNYVGVKDVVQGLCLALAKGRPGERYILGGQNLTLYELLKSIQKYSKKDLPKIKLNRPVLAGLALLLEGGMKLVGRRSPVTVDLINENVGRYYYYKLDKARRELGYNPAPLEKTLEETIGWIGGKAQC